MLTQWPRMFSSYQGIQAGRSRALASSNAWVGCAKLFNSLGAKPAVSSNRSHKRAGERRGLSVWPERVPLLRERKGGFR